MRAEVSADREVASARGADRTDSWAPMAVLLGLAAYANYAWQAGGVIAPFVAAGFGLDDAGIAFLAGCTSLGAIGTFALARRADRTGRRNVVVLCFAALPPLALCTALAPGVWIYAASQIAATALCWTLIATIPVVIAEAVELRRRAASQGYFGLVSALGGGLVILLAPLVAVLPGTWRWIWALAALPALALPVVRRLVPEPERFARAHARGVTAGSRSRDLFRGVYRRRAIGLLLAGTLRFVALFATSSWIYYHAVRTLALAPWLATAVLIGGGSVGMLGNALGARLADAWGRRPTLVGGAALAVGAGVLYYWVPPVSTGRFALALGTLVAANQLGFHVVGVANRCLETEMFPTPLRATYGGWARLLAAVALVLGQFALSGLARVLGGLPPAIALLSIAAIVPSIFVFLATAHETAGLELDAAVLEGERDER